MKNLKAIWLLLSAALISIFSSSGCSADLGLFENQSDIGKVGNPGSASYDPPLQAYSLAGGGENMWSTNDSFHFIWTRVSGDFSLQAAIQWFTSGGNPHKKACLLARQSLSPDSPYIDVAVHGNGLISLQYREVPAGPTREIQAITGTASHISPGLVALERQGETFLLSVLSGDAVVLSSPTPSRLQPSGAFFRPRLTDPLYVGLGVCAH